jgi:hypothetical protein
MYHKSISRSGLCNRDHGRGVWISTAVQPDSSPTAATAPAPSSAFAERTVLEPPEGGSAIALVDVRAPSPDSAAAAWRAYRPDASWPLKVLTGRPDKDGWTDRANYSYQTSPNEKRDVGVNVQRALAG